jgi:perosamine synthetase
VETIPDPLIPLTRPWMDEREAEAARRVILSGWVAQGPEVEAFEQEMAALVGAPYACAVSSCTTALHLALRAVGVGDGDEVVTASYSFIATANAVRYCGAVPMFVDIGPDGPNLDPVLVEASIGPRTKAILCVHQMGLPCDVGRLRIVADRHGLPLVEDAACAIGADARANGAHFDPIGRPHGDVACFSFDPRKILTTGQGGMVTSRDVDIDRRVRSERQHGVDISSASRHGARRIIDEEHRSFGYNARMTDIQAAVGRVQLSRLPDVLARRRALAARYQQLLSDLPVTLPRVPEWARPNWQSFWVGLPDGCDRQAVRQTLLDAGVATRRGVLCAHTEIAYQSEPWRAGAEGLVRSEDAQRRTILLPLYPQMTEHEQDRVVAALRLALAANP